QHRMAEETARSTPQQRIWPSPRWGFQSAEYGTRTACSTVTVSPVRGLPVGEGHDARHPPITPPYQLARTVEHLDRQGELMLGLPPDTRASTRPVGRSAS